MDAPPESPFRDPGQETQVRAHKDSETALSNALESGMEPPLVEGQVFGDFRIGALVGRGKAGFVYSAFDLVAKRRCALKVLCRMSSHDLYRNKLGFRRMSPFRHPCLLRTDRIEIIDEFTVLSMEEIEGETLYDAVLRYQELPAEEAYRRLHGLLHDYAVGLAILHLGGLVHRDLKPTNLMVRNDGHGVIVDYGLVANCDPETDPHGIRPYIAGTPRYFSPEALWEQSYTPAGDVFSLGLVMLDCLTEISGGDQWLRRGDFEDWVREEDERGIADAVSEMNESIPSVLRMAVAGMLHADRLERPSSLDIVAMTKTDDNPIRLATTHHLFGRERELEHCNQWVRGILRGKTGRLHLHGKAGAGKTRLLDEIERQLRQNQWGQVFRVKCRSRENGTLQVLDQIADQIAQRYARRDRETLRLDPVSASILTQSFPQLRHVIEQDIREASRSFPAAPERLDALSAVVRLSRALRDFGPVIIIIDDAQWSDHDSNTVWDALQQDTEGSLGIITCSRTPETSQRQPADQRVHVGPLAPDAALAFLHTAATRWGANINAAGLSELVEISRGNAFRLQELAEEFRPEGALHRVASSLDTSISNLGEVDRFWRARFDRLSDEAKSVLAYIVTAGAPVSIAQLAELSGQSDHVDVPVFELVRQRLVNDDATGGECITVVHDKIAEGLIENLDDDELHQAHLKWAALLSAQNRPRDFAARIAGHYYAAGEDGTALPFAIVAAENADRAFAKAEAGDWHERVLRQVVGDAREKHLHDAARCFLEADLPEKALPHFLALAAGASEPAERIRFQTIVCQLLARSGQMERARPLLAELAQQFGIRDAEDSDDAQAAARERLIDLAARLTDLSRSELPPQEPSAHAPAPGARDQMLEFCTQLRYSLMLLDYRSTLKLLLHGSQRAAHVGALSDRIHFGTAAHVWLTIVSGGSPASVADARDRLGKLLKVMADQPGSKMTAEIWAASAYVETLAMCWSAVPRAVSACVVDYIADPRPRRLEISHTRWLQLWADWQCGHWSELQALAGEMIEDAARRNDLYQQVVATAGYGGNALLCRDDLKRLRRLCADNTRIASGTAEVELVHFFQWMQAVQQSLYTGEFQNAWRDSKRMQASIDQSPLFRIPLVQVISDQLTALTALHLCESAGWTGKAMEQPPEIRTAIDRSLHRLEAHWADFPKMLAAMIRGIDARMREDVPTAAEQFVTARDLAEKLQTTPYQWAAEDALDRLRDPGSEADRLGQRMAEQGIRRTESLQRLYTVVAPRPSEGGFAGLDDQ